MSDLFDDEPIISPSVEIPEKWKALMNTELEGQKVILDFDMKDIKSENDLPLKFLITAAKMIMGNEDGDDYDCFATEIEAFNVARTLNEAYEIMDPAAIQYARDRDLKEHYKNLGVQLGILD